MSTKKYHCGCAICKNYKEFEMPSDIIEAAKKGKLALFCGAGISTENKNVLPESFYTSIQNELGIIDNNMSFSETMQKYCDLPDGRRKLIKKIQERFKYIHSFPELETIATMFHRELSELYFIKTIITTNWDTYFEDYCAAIPITIPEDFVYWNTDERYVLKIHGSISNLGTIVATRNDYKKCKDNLEKGIIGAKLKTILANNTVVFIGFSFGDEDFASILDYLHDEMKDFYPHIYIVTLDSNLYKSVEYKNSTYIVSDGTFFLHSLKNTLVENHLIVNTGIKDDVISLNSILREEHKKVATIDFVSYPEVIYCLAYQDGIGHAFDRFIQLYNTGEYNVPGRLERYVESYDRLIEEKKKQGNYWDVAYYNGYMNGLIYILLCGQKKLVFNFFEMFYLPNTKSEMNSFESFKKELSRVSGIRGKYHRYALRTISDCKEMEGVVVHHPPF